MRIANIHGRLHLKIDDATAVDVAEASDGRFSPDPQAIYDQWDELVAWAQDVEGPGKAFQPSDLGSPVPRPGQLFAIGLNYRDHAAEANFTLPDSPTVFTKFRGAITGPYGTITLPEGGNTDWEVELAVVIGRRADFVAEAQAWRHVAGLTVAQDLSERIVQMAGQVPQFSLGKSYPGFAPMGPCVVTPDEVHDRDNLALGCSVNGETMQDGRTSDLVFSISQLIERLSAIVPLEPGDVILSGTPAGVGMARNPQRFLEPGDVLDTWIEGVGSLQHRFAAVGR